MTIIEKHNFIIINNTNFNIKIKTNVIDSYLGNCSLVLTIIKPNTFAIINLQSLNFLTLLGDYNIECLDHLDKIPIFYLKYGFEKIYIETH